MFFGTLIAGSIASQIKVFLEQPTLFLTTLGTAAPLTSIFFLTYVELNVRGRCSAARAAVAHLGWHDCFCVHWLAPSPHAPTCCPAAVDAQAIVWLVFGFEEPV